MRTTSSSPSRPESRFFYAPNTSTNTTHLMWIGRWIEVCTAEVDEQPAWEFKSGRDAADWLLA